MSDASHHSIIEAMCSYASGKPTRMHMPGHKGRKAFSTDSSSIDVSPERAAVLLDELRAIDMTESPGLDNLHYPTGCIRDTEARAERLFGSARTFFLVNGATSGIQGSLLAIRMTLGPGTVVLPRNVHKSLVSALGMSGLEPVFAWPEYDSRFGGYLPLDWPRVKKVLTDLEDRGEPSPKAVFVINPTYSGFARDLSEMAAEVHARGMALVVDEAHGTHFALGKGLPPTALRSGADLVTHGAHKTTVAYTQTALLHIGSSAPGRFPGLPASVEEALRFVISTSPSYILMASLEQAVQAVEMDGGAWIDRGTERDAELALRLSRIPGLSVACCNNGDLPPGLMHDPSKVLVNLGGLGVTGPDAVKFLVRSRGVVPEMTGPKNILLLVSGAHGPQDVDKVESAFRDLAARYPGRQGEEAPAVASNGDDTAALQHGLPHPARAMTLREAFISVATPVPVEEAAGKISADTVVIYPPGSPLITPGERIDQDVVEYILHARKAGLNVLGRGIRSGEGELMVYCVASS